jgi:hypothetical protein
MEWFYANAGQRHGPVSATEFASLARQGEIKSPYRGGTTLSDVLAWAERATGDDVGGARAEFLDLVRRARDLRREPAGSAPSARGGTVDPLRY